MELFILAVVIVLSLITTLVRVVSIKLLFGYAVFVDLLFSLTITAAFLGTFKGVIAATLAGLLLGVALTIGKALMGFQRAKIVRLGRFRWSVQIVEYPPKFKPGFGVFAMLLKLSNQVSELNRKVDSFYKDKQDAR